MACFSKERMAEMIGAAILQIQMTGQLNGVDPCPMCITNILLNAAGNVALFHDEETRRKIIANARKMLENLENLPLNSELRHDKAH